MGGHAHIVDIDKHGGNYYKGANGTGNLLGIEVRLNDFRSIGSGQYVEIRPVDSHGPTDACKIWFLVDGAPHASMRLHELAAILSTIADEIEGY